MGTNQIGRFDLEIDTKNNCTKSWVWQCIPINDKTCPRDEKLEELINTYKGQTDSKYGRVITRFKRELTHPDRYQETELGDLFADILKNSLGVDVMLLGSGSIRKPVLGPVVTLQDLMEIFPFDDSIHMVYVSGKQLKDMLLFMLRDEAFEGDHTEFYQLSEGLYLEYDKKTKIINKFTFNNRAIKDDDMFTLALQKYHYLNIEGGFNVSLKDLEVNGKPRILATSCRDVLEEYLGENQHLDVDIKKNPRLVIKNRK
jgi:5'-nucleotidase